MGQKRYTEAFKIEAVRQVTEAGHSVYDVANQLGISNKSLCAWINAYGPRCGLMRQPRLSNKSSRSSKPNSNGSRRSMTS